MVTAWSAIAFSSDTSKYPILENAQAVFACRLREREGVMWDLVTKHGAESLMEQLAYQVLLRELRDPALSLSGHNFHEVSIIVTCRIY